MPSLVTAEEAASPLTTLPYFGHKAGNFQPDSTTSKNVTKRDTGEWVSIPNLARWDTSNIQDGIGQGTDQYIMRWGSGQVSAGWPARSQWVSFQQMFDYNKNLMFSSCSQWNMPNNSGDEVGQIWNAIQKVAGETGVDHRFILAVVLQESGGCVRAPTSNYGVRNPGLMQDHDGSATCHEGDWYLNPCPTATIEQMIREGTAGTSSGDGLANCLNSAASWNTNGGNDSDFYRAARIYNSGSIADGNHLEAGIATHCYASDIAK
ncbi:hypothetical protein GQ53DRAFT_860596 [Thozetella sp. PMI_491]|nr:hypothetical protein GQ53DRAFT_860596 [Thozetella sp. PMI_491]